LRTLRAVLCRLAPLGFVLALAVATDGCAPAPRPTEGANVVILMVDALRADRLGCYGHTAPTSPFVDTLAREGVLFERAFSAAPQTVPSALSLWSGVYPSRHGNLYFPTRDAFRMPGRRYRPRVPAGLPLMAELFAQHGYTTAAVMSNPWLRPEFGFARGFDHYVHLPRRRRPVPRGPQVNANALNLLGHVKGGRFLLYVHYMDVHNPYEPPAAYRDAFAGRLPGRYVYLNGPFPLVQPEDLAFTQALYDAGVRAVDDQIRDIGLMIRAHGLGPSTIVVVLSDHGDEFQEHGGLGHGWTLHEEMLHTPLVVVHPGLVPAGRRIATPVSHVDLLPTLLDLTGLPIPPGLDGVSLAPLLLGAEDEGDRPERALYAELGDGRAIRRGERKLIRMERNGTREEAYDLAADPGERRPVAERPPWVRALAAELAAFADAAVPLEPATADELPPPPDPHLEEQLRALGYVR
jgi:arylsulfatase A-like enzyme